LSEIPRVVKNGRAKMEHMVPLVSLRYDVVNDYVNHGAGGEGQGIGQHRSGKGDAGRTQDPSQWFDHPRELPVPEALEGAEARRL
jgi:hypothetical protein